MKKRIFLVVLCLMVLTTGAFAMEKTAGFGGAFRTFENLTGFGGFGFFGPGRYIELSVGFSYYSHEYWDDNLFTAQLGLYGKFPFVLTDRLVLFPTGGLELEYAFESEELIFWGLLGGGLDFFLTENMFLRTHALFGLGRVADFSGFGFSFKVGLGWMF